MTDDEKKDLASRIAYAQGTLESNPPFLAQPQNIVESARQDLADEKKLDAMQQEFDALGEQFEKPAAKPDH